MRHGVRTGYRVTMAYLGFSPPEPFDFQCPYDWMKWKRHFECFQLASGLAKEDEDRQVSALLYCMGPSRQCFNVHKDCNQRT